MEYPVPIIPVRHRSEEGQTTGLLKSVEGESYPQTYDAEATNDDSTVTILCQHLVSAILARLSGRPFCLDVRPLSCQKHVHVDSIFVELLSASTSLESLL